MKTLTRSFILLFTSIMGIGAFLVPFIQPISQQSNLNQAGAERSPLFLTALVAICLLGVLFEAQTDTQTGGEAHHTSLIALLGVLVALNSMLRYIEIAIPGPAGFTPIFALIVIGGYLFGSMFGLLLGAMTLFVSALITGGVGPWLPFQMFAAGWVGLSAPLCRPLVRLIGGQQRWREVLVLAIFGGIWGFLFGALMNLWFWPYSSGSATLYWTPGISVAETFQRYLAFYALTSLVWDAFGAAGNTILILIFGMPALRALRRFQRRLTFAYHPPHTVGEPS